MRKRKYITLLINLSSLLLLLIIPIIIALSKDSFYWLLYWLPGILIYAFIKEITYFYGKG
jgi:hypothetical protein